MMTSTVYHGAALSVSAHAQSQAACLVHARLRLVEAAVEFGNQEVNLANLALCIDVLQLMLKQLLTAPVSWVVA